MNRKTLLAIAIMTACSSGLLATNIPLAYASYNPAKSSADKSAKSESKETAQDRDFVKTSDNAAITMRNVHGARLAIFDGAPDQALTYVDAAITRVEATMKEADRYAMNEKADKKDKAKLKAGDVYVPYDATLAVGEDFVPTKKSADNIKRANKYIRKGEKKQALETLKLGDVDVAVSTRMMPVKLSEKLIKDAGKLIDAGKFYEANLDLKAVEDSVVIETFAADGTPKENKTS